MNALDIPRVIQDAMGKQSGIVCLYEHDDQKSARVLYPASCKKAKSGTLSVRAWDSLRQEWRSFRVDRIHQAHPLRGPPSG